MQNKTSRGNNSLNVISGFYLFVLFSAMIWFVPATVEAGLIGEDFSSNQTFVKGAVVSIDKNNPNDITLSTLSNSEYLLGAVVNSGENLVTFSKNDSSVSIALNGEVSVLA